MTLDPKALASVRSKWTQMPEDVLAEIIADYHSASLPADVAELVVQIEDRAHEVYVYGTAAQVGPSAEELRQIATALTALSARAEAAEGRMKALEAALEPFADVADLVDAETEGISETDEFILHFHDYMMASWPLSLFRATRSALAKEAGNV